MAGHSVHPPLIDRKADDIIEGNHRRHMPQHPSRPDGDILLMPSGFRVMLASGLFMETGGAMRHRHHLHDARGAGVGRKPGGGATGEAPHDAFKDRQPLRGRRPDPSPTRTERQQLALARKDG
jgi:hypothetical protein